MNINELIYIAKITREMEKVMMEDEAKVLDACSFIYFIDNMMKKMGYSYDESGRMYRRDK